MVNPQEIFNRIQKTKKEQKEIKAMYKDALENSKAYQEAVEELRDARDKKKKIEDGIKDEFRSEFDKLDTLKMDLENDNMLLSDAALVKLTKGEPIELMDEKEQKYEPVFTVRFKKA
jgi:predicted transposase YdaD